MAVALKNPEAPATKRQLYRIYELSGFDTRNANINMQQASDIIESLEMDLEAEQSSQLYIPNDVTPFSESKVTLIEGEQRSGKTCTAVAKIVDDYNADCARNFVWDKFGVDCTVKYFDDITRTTRIVHNGQTHDLVIPKDYQLHSDIRIFANIHLFGVPFVFVPSFRHLLKWLRNGFCSYGWLLIDEAHVGMNARSSMGKLQQELSGQSFQFAKAMLKVIIVSHLSRMIDWRARTIPTERLHCSFDRRNWRVTYTNRKKGKSNESTISYYAPRYYRYYWTNERINQ